MENLLNARNGPQRPLHSIYFYLTAGCNLNCCHCWIRPRAGQGQSPSSAVLDLKLFKSVVEQARELGLVGVKLTGGEPLSHPAITDILKYLQGEKLKVDVETNGTLVTAEIAREIAKCSSVTISISLDGRDAVTHERVRGVRGCFEAAIAGARQLVNNGIRPQIIMSLMPDNLPQVEEVVKLAESLGARSVKLNIIQPSARGKDLQDEGKTIDLKTLIATGKWVEEVLPTLTSIPVFYSHPHAFRPLGRIFRKSHRSASTCNILGTIGVLANGNYALCGIGATVPELVFGPIESQSLADVWNNTPVLNEIRTGLPDRLEGVCADCIMRGLLCPGFCIAQNYNVAKNLWAPYWYCQEAYEQGLFPVSRLASKLRD